MSNKERSFSNFMLRCMSLSAAEKESGGHLHGKPRQRRAAGLLRLFHQNARNIRNAAQRKIGGEIEFDFVIWLAGSDLSVLRRTDIVTLIRRSGISIRL
jgi:hypothetical protein